MDAGVSRGTCPAGGNERVLVGGLIAYAAHEAARLGDRGLSGRLEDIFVDIAKALPPGERRTLMLMSHEIALRDAMPEPVRLYLVKS